MKAPYIEELIPQPDPFLRFHILPISQIELSLQANLKFSNFESKLSNLIKLQKIIKFSAFLLLYNSFHFTNDLACLCFIYFFYIKFIWWRMGCCMISNHQRKYLSPINLHPSTEQCLTLLEDIP